LLTQLFKALLFRHKDETVPQAQDCKRRTNSQPKILAELLGNSKLALLADLGRSQVFECGIVSYPSVGKSYYERGPAPTIVALSTTKGKFAMSKESLFSPLQTGAIQLPDQIIMALLTRMRAGANNVPTPMNAEYYAQRASAGLIIS
jgi:hypothetical protein